MKKDWVEEVGGKKMAAVLMVHMQQVRAGRFVSLFPHKKYIWLII